MKKLVTILSTLLLSACNLFSSENYEQPEYKVLKSEGNIEIREYKKFIVAETVVEGTRKTAPNKAFRVLAEYIFGGNKNSQKIPMTAPVLIEKETDKLWSMKFMMPKKFVMNELPLPNTDKIIFKEVNNRQIAAITFSGRWTKDNFQENADELLNYIKKHDYKINSREINAFYNDPFTLPWNRRNEIMFEIID
jgi:hypothetical protein